MAARYWELLRRTENELVRASAGAEFSDDFRSANDESVNSLNEQIAKVQKAVWSSFKNHVILKLEWLEYCLRCTWFMATLELTVASPPPETLRAFLTQFSSAYDLPDGKLAELTADAKEEKMTRVREAASLITHFHARLRENFPPLLSTADPQEEDEGMVGLEFVLYHLRELPQVSELCDQDPQLDYDFPEEVQEAVHKGQSVKSIATVVYTINCMDYVLRGMGATGDAEDGTE
jgi:hypothetical protein